MRLLFHLLMMVAVSFIHPLRSAQHQGGSNEPRKFQAGAKIRMNKMESELRSAKYELRAVKNELHQMKTRLEKSERSLQALVKALLANPLHAGADESTEAHSRIYKREVTDDIDPVKQDDLLSSPTLGGSKCGGAMNGTDGKDGRDDENVPCAICYSENSAVIMIPAKRYCPESWHKEYEGYLIAGHVSHTSPSSYRCVDQNPQHIDMGEENRNTNGALLYFIKPDCYGTQTTGHCPPYDPERQLTCVICTK